MPLSFVTNPYLVGKAEGLTGPERYGLANQLFYERTAAHFDLLWRRYLDDNARTVLVMLSLVELGGIIQDLVNLALVKLSNHSDLPQNYAN